MLIWLSKPIYVLVPWFYAVAGILLLAASLYLEGQFWPVLCRVSGVFCLAGAATIILRRRRPGAR